MALNIKDEEVHALAKEIAQLTGESLTEVVRQALIVRKEVLTKQDRHTEARRLLAQMQQAVKESGVRLSVDDLYDEWGLPK